MNLQELNDNIRKHEKDKKNKPTMVALNSKDYWYILGELEGMLNEKAKNVPTMYFARPKDFYHTNYKDQEHFMCLGVPCLLNTAVNPTSQSGGR